MKALYFILIVTLWILGFECQAQQNAINLPMIDQTVSDFRLTDQNGKTVVLSDYTGKNVMLIFPRGMVKKDYWCQICHYQYADIADLEKYLQLGKNTILKYCLSFLTQPIQLKTG